MCPLRVCRAGCRDVFLGDKHTYSPPFRYVVPITITSVPFRSIFSGQMTKLREYVPLAHSGASPVCVTQQRMMCVCASLPLLFAGVENDGLVGGIVVPLQLVAEDPLTRIAVK